MTTVFVVQHAHSLPDGSDDVKLIGVYATREDALEAIGRLAHQPGFADHPEICDPSNSAEQGFHIDAYEIGKDHWQEGFVTTQ